MVLFKNYYKKSLICKKSTNLVRFLQISAFLKKSTIFKKSTILRNALFLYHVINVIIVFTTEAMAGDDNNSCPTVMEIEEVTTVG